LLAALALAEMGANNSGVALILGGMLYGAALWILVAVCSIPVFFLIKPWIEVLARTATRLRGAVLAAAGAIPFVLIAIVGWVALPLEKSAQTNSTVAAGAVLILGVTFGLGTVAAAEMWNLVFGTSHHRHAQFNHTCDISVAVRVKEDLEALRLLLANSAMAGLSMLTALLPISLIGLLVLAYQTAENSDGLRWVVFVPAVVFLLFVPLLIALTSYQIGLWHFVSVRASGIFLFAAASGMLIAHVAEPFYELYVGSLLGYSQTAWIYTVFLWLVSIPGFAVIASVLGMSLRFVRFSPHLEPVVRGWRAWPTNFLALASRTLCLPSFLTALPRGRFQSVLLFALVVVLLALRTALVLGPAINAPAVLASVVSERTDVQAGLGREPPQTMGAAITSRSATEWRALLTRETLSVLPFFLVLAVLFAAARLNRRLAARCLRVAHRRAAAIYQEIMEHDTRAPILFLRSFKDEKRLFEPPARSLLAKALRLRDLRRTLDEIVLDAASPVGPVLALGVPAENVAPLGAARLYADHAEWQDAVRGLVQRSRAVVICVEEGDGVLWELKHLLTDAHAARTLCILTPPTSSATIRRAIAESRQSANVAVCDRLEQIETHGSQPQSGKCLVGVWFPNGTATPIFADNSSDYTHWCMVNLVLAALTSG
jgi:hypothetical protein